MKLSELKPSGVWRHFEEITHIPRPSHHEEQIRDYIVRFAKKNGLQCKVDEAHNVIVRKPATKGMEDRETVVIQAHVDMVPQKNGDKVFDFEKDGIQAYVDGEWVTADGTTLGADDGIGVSCILAVLESKDVPHGAIEALFTATEETGMDGAFGLAAGELTGKILLNLDSETEGELYVGCAGGTDANIEFKYKSVAAPKGTKAYMTTVKGLKGGHSGIEIILGRANANKLLARVIRRAQQKLGAEVATIDGGGLRNAIPREAQATILVPAAKAKGFEKLVKEFAAIFAEEYKGIDEGITLTAVATETPKRIIPTETAVRLAQSILACPNGVVAMSTSMKGLVQTSNNLARVVSDGKTIKLAALTRSSVRSEKEYTCEMIRSAFELAGAKVELTGSYDGWNPDMTSPILAAMRKSYKGLYKTEPKVVAIHAGLECGVIGGKYPGMDMISFGPTICYPHSPDEKVNIASVEKFWDFLCHTLANAPKK